MIDTLAATGMGRMMARPAKSKRGVCPLRVLVLIENAVLSALVLYVFALFDHSFSMISGIVEMSLMRMSDRNLNCEIS